MTHHIEQPPRFDVAVLYPGTSGLVREIVRGILAASEETDPKQYLRCSYFVASELDTTAQHETIAALVDKNPQLIISVGYAHTKAIIEYLNSHANSHIPLICTATDGLTISVEIDAEKEAAQMKARAESKKPLLQEDPVIIRHIHTLVDTYHGPAMALERGDLDQQQMLRSLITLHPTARRILVPFTADAQGWGQSSFECLQHAANMLPDPLWEEREKRRNKELNKTLHDGDDTAYETLKATFDAERLKEKKQQEGKPYCTLIPLPLTSSDLPSIHLRLDEILKKDRKIAAVIALEDYALGDANHAIMKVCASRHTLFFGNSAAAVHRGAAAGFGGSYSTLGSECFTAAYDHLIRKKKLKINCSRHIAINREPLCNIARCRALDLKEQYLQNFLHLPRITTVESP